MAKSEEKVAKRYAKALFELYQHDQIESVSQALEQLKTVWVQSPELQNAMMNPAFKVNERIAVISEVIGRVRSGDKHFENFFAVLIENDRIRMLPQISKAFAAMLNELKKILSLTVVSAFELDEGEKRAVLQKIKTDYGTMATIEWQSDPQIIGGLMIKSGDKLFDRSIRGSLDKIQESLIG